jgi:hypothetical protein
MAPATPEATEVRAVAVGQLVGQLVAVAAQMVAQPEAQEAQVLAQAPLGFSHCSSPISLRLTRVLAAAAAAEQAVCTSTP